MKFNRSQFALCTAAGWLLCFVLLGSAAADEAAPSIDWHKVDAVFEQWNNWDSPGASLAVVRDGKLAYARGYGSANLEYRVPITPQTPFHVASVSKQFTCFAIVLLARDGKLSLDDDIRKHLDEVPDFGTPVTIRHLIHHTSGLRDQWETLAMSGWRLDDVITREHILKMVGRQRELNFKPNSEHLYCNTGYTLLAEIVARASGQSFADFTRERIFKPLGMINTHFHDDHELIVPGRAYSYSKDKDSYRNSVLSYANVGATSLFTTAEDLARWLVNFEDPQVGGSDGIAMMLEPGVLNDGKKLNYAFGLTHSKRKSLDVVSHSGSDAGYRTFVMRVPEKRLGIVVLSNLASFNPVGAANKVADIVLADADKPAEQKTAEEKPAEEKPAGESTEPVAVDPKVLDRYVGNFGLDIGPTVELSRVEGKLFVDMGDGKKLELTNRTDKEFVIDGIGARVVFDTAEDKPAESFTAYLGDQTIHAKRVAEKPGQDLKALAGTYYSPELDTIYRIVESDGTLVAKHQRHPDITLKPSGEDQFRSPQWFFSKVRFERGEGGKITGMRVSGFRVRNVKFERRDES